eukprot:gene7144-9747_t
MTLEPLNIAIFVAMAAVLTVLVAGIANLAITGDKARSRSNQLMRLRVLVQFIAFGRVMCQALAKRGCKLIVGDCDLTAARDTAAKTEGLALGLDVTDAAMWTNAASSARDLFGPLDYVFHCAQHRAEGTDAESMARLWATQVSSLEIAYRNCRSDLGSTGGVHVIFVSGAAIPISDF